MNNLTRLTTEWVDGHAHAAVGDMAKARLHLEESADARSPGKDARVLQTFAETIGDKKLDQIALKCTGNIGERLV